jgi:hypothetical protein
VSGVVSCPCWTPGHASNPRCVLCFIANEEWSMVFLYMFSIYVSIFQGNVWFFLNQLLSKIRLMAHYIFLYLPQESLLGANKQVIKLECNGAAYWRGCENWEPPTVKLSFRENFEKQKCWYVNHVCSFTAIWHLNHVWSWTELKFQKEYHNEKTNQNNI